MTDDQKSPIDPVSIILILLTIGASFIVIGFFYMVTSGGFIPDQP